MKARRLSEVRSLVASPEFQAWFKELVDLREKLKEVEARRDELLGQLHLTEFRAELAQKNAIDTLYRAGEHEDKSAQMLAEAEELENKSFPGVAAFEEGRFKTSELWYRLGAAEKTVEDARQAKRPADEIASLEKRHAQLKDEYAREEAKKARLWDDVERLWTRSAEVSLLMAEERMQAKKVRALAEAAFAQAEEKKKQVQALRTEVEAASKAVETTREKLKATRAAADERFGCSAGTDFVYFRHRDDQRHAYAIALATDPTSYNVEVRALSVYSVDRARGASFLEPARAQPLSLEEGDRRFDEYFLKGRRGETRGRPEA
jgi:hypothetical protein